MIASLDQLQTYLVDLVEYVERFGLTILPPEASDFVEILEGDAGQLLIEFTCRPPLEPHSKNVDMSLAEIWLPADRSGYERGDYKFELLDHELQFRRALHRHSTDHFIRTYNVVTHEHCESSLGVERCGHYAGVPVENAFDGFDRLFNTWLEKSKPQCGLLRCLG